MPDAPEPAAPEPGAARRVRHAASVSLLHPHAIMAMVVVIGGGAVFGAAPARWAYAGAACAVSWLWFAFLSLAGCVLYAGLGGRAAARHLGRASAVVMGTVAPRTVWRRLG